MFGRREMVPIRRSYKSYSLSMSRLEMYDLWHKQSYNWLNCMIISNYVAERVVLGKAFSHAHNMDQQNFRDTDRFQAQNKYHYSYMEAYKWL